MEKLRIGIIGTGSISHLHMAGYKELEAEGRVEIVSCCDLDEGKLNRYCDKYGVARRYTNCEEMMAKEQLDCVSVCVWTVNHAKCTIAALKGGAHVLCEKPMAMNAAEAEEMLNTAKACGKMLQIGFVRRFGEDAETIQRLVEDGTFGDIYYAKAIYLRQQGCPGGWFGDKAYSGGGPLIDLGVHVIDLTRYLAGNPRPVSAFGVTYDNLGPHRASGSAGWTIETGPEAHPYTVEDLCVGMVRFENGLTLTLETSFNLNIPGDVGDVELYGTKAGTSLSKMNILAVKDHQFVTFTPEEPHSFRFQLAFNAEIRGFVDASQGLVPCKATAEDGVWLMKIIDALYESAKTGASVAIS